VGAAFSAGTPDGADPFTLSLGPSCAPLPDPPAPYPACADLPTCGCDPATLAPCGTALYLWLVDADADGVVDPDPDPDLAAAGIFDVWPRVYLEFTGELATFEHEGRILPERWVSQAFPLLGEAVTVATQSAYAGYPISPAQAAGLLGAPVGTPTPLHSLSVTFTPVFVHYHADGVLVDPAKGPYDVVDLGAGGVLPPEVLGAWAVTLVSFTGQTWTLPNDIGLLGLPSIDPLFDPTTQAVPLYLVE
jgi:hypothetical protein